MTKIQSVQTEDYPFVEELLLDKTGEVLKVVLPIQKYLSLIEALEDEGLYRAMNQVRDESPLDKEAALALLNTDED